MSHRRSTEHPLWLNVLIWIAGALMILTPLALIIVGALWPAVFLRAVCFASGPVAIMIFALGAILMKPIEEPEKCAQCGYDLDGVKAEDCPVCGTPRATKSG